MARFRAPWIRALLGLVGGLALGFGIGRLAHGVAVGPALSVVLGVILLWWAIMEPRKVRPDTPESEAGGNHTIE